MQSPIRHLLADHVPNSIFTIAPEREAEFDKSLNEFDLILTNERPWKFCADPITRKVSVSRGAVELIWCASLAHFLFYTQVVQGKIFDRPTEIDPRSDPAVRKALDLLRWAIKCQLKKNTADDWPDDLPTPQAAPPDGAENAANELCLVSCAFILHHELAHLNLGHSAQVSDALSISQEKDADIAAAEWILGRIDKSSPMFTKRMLGVVQAHLLTTAMGLYGGDLGGKRHPFSYDRLTSLLSRFADTRDHVATWVAYAVLDLHFQNSGRKLKQQSFADAHEALAALCDQLADEVHGLKAQELAG
jgi:hypothetical protein